MMDYILTNDKSSQMKSWDIKQYNCCIHEDNKNICKIYECDGSIQLNNNLNKVPSYINWYFYSAIYSFDRLEQ